MRWEHDIYVFGYYQGASCSAPDLAMALACFANVAPGGSLVDIAY